MDRNALSILNVTFTEVMEEMAFMFSEPLGKEYKVSAEKNFHSTSICFSGLVNGTVKIVTTFDFCIMLTANMLGIESCDELCAQKAEDGLKEALNTICGRFLTDAYGETDVFDISIPDSAPCDFSAMNELMVRPDTLLFEIDGQPLAICLTVACGHEKGIEKST